MISVVELRLVAVPLLTPFVTAHGVESERAVVIVRVADDTGGEGWGEVSTLTSPGYSPEWTDGAFSLLRDHLVPALFAEGPAVLDDAAKVTPMAVAGLRLALLDLGLRRDGRSLAEELGAGVRRVPWTAVLGTGPDAGIDRLVAAAAAAVDDGAAQVKLKIGPGWDLEPLRAVQAALADRPAVGLAADANGSYAAGGPPPALDELGLRYVEQPLAAADLPGHAALASAWTTPIALDESVPDLATARAAVDSGAADLLNVKAARLGGVAQAAEVLRWAGERGVGAYVGGMLELGIGRAAGVALAALTTTPTDVGPTRRYVENDLTAPVRTDADGALLVPAGPGLGVVPDPVRLDAATRDRAEVRGR